MSLCSCCGEREADDTFPGLTPSTRDLRGRPVAQACFVDLLAQNKGAAELAARIRERDEAMAKAPPVPTTQAWSEFAERAAPVAGIATQPPPGSEEPT